MSDRQPMSRRADWQPNVLKKDRRRLPTGANVAQERKVKRGIDSGRKGERPSGKQAEIEAILYGDVARNVDRAGEVIVNALRGDERVENKEEGKENEIKNAEGESEKDMSKKKVGEKKVSEKKVAETREIETVEKKVAMVANTVKDGEKQVEVRETEGKSFVKSVWKLFGAVITELATVCKGFAAWFTTRG